MARERARHPAPAQAPVALNEKGQALTALLKETLQELQPEIVYSHWRGDLNRDHKIIAEAVEVATRPLPGCPVKEVYAFEIPGDRQFVPDVWVVMSVSDLHDKEEQMSIKYMSELQMWPHPRSKRGIESQAKYRGMQCGHEYAEAFQVVRIVR